MVDYYKGDTLFTQNHFFIEWFGESTNTFFNTP